MKVDLRPLIRPSQFLIIAVYTLISTVWIGLYFIMAEVAPLHGFVLGYLEGLLPTSSLVANILSLLIVLLNSLLITQVNVRFSFIRERSFLPVFLYLFINLCWVQLHGYYALHLMTTFILIIISLLFSSYNRYNSVESTFLIGFLTTVIVAFLPDYFYLLVAIVWSLLILQSFSVRIFFSLFTGVLTPWVLYAGVQFFIFEKVQFLPDFTAIAPDWAIFSHFNILEVSVGGAIGLLFLIVLVGMGQAQRTDLIQTRKYLNIFTIFIYFLLGLSLLRFESRLLFLPLVSLLFSLIVAYTITLVRTKFYGFVFIAILGVNGLILAMSVLQLI